MTQPTDGSSAQQVKDQVKDAARATEERARSAAGQARSGLRDQVDARSTQAGDRIGGQAQDVRSVAKELRRQGKDGPAVVIVEDLLKRPDTPAAVYLLHARLLYRAGEVEVPALKGVSLHIPEGEFVAIMGPSGSGKSTLMNVIGCLDQPTEGRYILDGYDVSALTDDQLAWIRNRKIGFVFQSFNLIPRVSAAHNVEMPLIYAGDSVQRRERAMAALESVGLLDRAGHLPNELSGGQQQRVAVARALVTDPAILLADEPTGNLDTESSLEILKLLRDLNQQGRTIVLITHEADIAAFAQRVVRLRDGVILSDERQALATEVVR